MVDSYTLVFAGLLLTAGALGDRFGRRGALQVGFAIFGLGSLRSAFADTRRPADRHPGLHGHRRRVHHAGDAVDHHQRVPGPASGAGPSASGPASPALGAALGPLTGGFLLEHFYWGSVFLVNVPDRDRRPARRRASSSRLEGPDARRGSTRSARSCRSPASPRCSTPSSRRPPRAGATPTIIVGASSSAAVLLGRLRLWERRSRPPDARRARSSGTPGSPRPAAPITLTFFAMFGSFFLLTQYLQFVLGYTPLETGVRMLPFAVTMMVVAPDSARGSSSASAPRSPSADRHGPRDARLCAR